MKRGFITVKPNCSIQSYVPALHPLREFGIEKVFVCTYQAISGAGKTFKDWPEMVDNVMPFIGGEEEKSEIEPLKVWGSVEADGIMNASGPAITSQCIRVPVTDGHLAAVFVSFERKPSTGRGSSSCGRASRESRRSSAAQRAEAVPHLFHGGEPAADPAGPGRGRRRGSAGMGITIGRLRDDRLAGLPVRLPFPQYHPGRGRWRGAHRGAAEGRRIHHRKVGAIFFSQPLDYPDFFDTDISDYSSGWRFSPSHPVTEQHSAVTTGRAFFGSSGIPGNAARILRKKYSSSRNP